MNLNFVNNAANQFGQNPIRWRVKTVLFSFIKSVFRQFQEDVMDQVAPILWESAQKKAFTRKNIDAKIAAVESPWILTNQGPFSYILIFKDFFYQKWNP